MHITITGNLGSGKSTICKLLSEKYQFEIYSTGKIQRELAQEMNMTTLELNKLMRSDHKYDHMIDDATTKISRENRDKDILFDSRLAWNFVEESFKVFVSVSLDVAAERVMKDQRGEVEQYSTMEEARKLLEERAETEKVRYKEVYHLDYMDFSNYDLVIDSTYCTPDKIAEIILEEARAYEKKRPVGTKKLVSPRRLLKEEDIREEDIDKLQELVHKYTNQQYAIEETVKVVRQEGCYEIVKGMAQAKAASLANKAYVPIEVIKE